MSLLKRDRGMPDKAGPCRKNNQNLGKTTCACPCLKPCLIACCSALLTGVERDRYMPGRQVSSQVKQA
eukprot:647396-Pelagomonas_calceolata.AAC.3